MLHILEGSNKSFARVHPPHSRSSWCSKSAISRRTIIVPSSPNTGLFQASQAIQLCKAAATKLRMPTTTEISRAASARAKALLSDVCYLVYRSNQFRGGRSHMKSCRTASLSPKYLYSREFGSGHVRAWWMKRGKRGRASLPCKG